MTTKLTSAGGPCGTTMSTKRKGKRKKEKKKDVNKVFNDNDYSHSKKKIFYCIFFFSFSFLPKNMEIVMDAPTWVYHNASKPE